MNQESQLEVDCSSFLQDSAQGTKPRVAAWGLVKAGKSSLLNMLSGHVEDEFFKTGAIRTTRLNQELEAGHYVLVDTPGLGIDRDDSQQACKGLDGADVILFVHAPPGELDQEEMDLLAQVKATFGEATEQRLVVVLSQLDKDQDGAFERIRQRILEQMQERLDIRPQCFQVSNSRYQKGATREQQNMIKGSGIPDLVAHLDTLSLAIMEELESVRSSRRAARKAELLEELDHAIAAESSQIAQLQKPYVARLRAFNRMMAELKEGFASRTAEITAAQKKLNIL